MSIGRLLVNGMKEIKNMNKVKFDDLSGWLKLAVITSWMLLAYLIIYVMLSFFIAFMVLITRF
jgi:hypothetical protein